MHLPNLSDIHLPCCVYIESANEGIPRISEIAAAAVCRVGFSVTVRKTQASVRRLAPPPKTIYSAITVISTSEAVCVMVWCDVSVCV